MAARWLLSAMALLGITVVVQAADLTKVPRAIGKEPAYKTKSPRYLLLVFGPDAVERVWLIQDGDTLHVDRNGNGDLTDPGEAVATKQGPGADPDVDGRGFDGGDLSVGGRVHKSLVVGTVPLSRLADEIRDTPHARQLLRANANAHVVSLTLEVRHPTLKGPGVEGRVPMLVGPLDLDGMLVFAETAKEAPIVHFDGGLQVTFYGGRPTLEIGRETDMILAVGCAGLGKGTLAMLNYDETIPEGVYPKVKISYPGLKAEDPRVEEDYVLKERC